jgi:hypothetical protein
LYRSPNIGLVKAMQSIIYSWAGHVARIEKYMSAFKILTVTPMGKRPSGRHRHRLEDNIRIDLKEIIPWTPQ